MNKPSNKITTVLVALGILSSCGLDESESKKAARQSSSYRGLFFSATDYQTGSLQFYDFETGEIEEVLSNTGGDQLLTASSDEIFYFDRTSGKQSYRSFEIAEGKFSKKIEETAIGDGGLGDPHDAIALSNGKLLLALGAVGQLLVVDEAGKKESVNFSPTLGDVTFYPADLARVERDDGNYILVVHFGKPSGELKGDGSQKLFVLKEVLGELSPANSEGIPLNSTTPTIHVASDGGIFAIGNCFDQAQDCTASVDKIDLDNNTAEQVWDLSTLDYTKNGELVLSRDGKRIYAALAQGESYSIVRLDIGSKGAVKLHSFPAGSSGCCGLFYDNTSDALYVGDYVNKIASLTAYYSDGSSEEVLRSADFANPYAGVFVGSQSQ